MAAKPTAWPNVELQNLDNSLNSLLRAIDQTESKKRKRRGYKEQKASGKEEAEAEVADDLESVVNHLFTNTSPRPSLSTEKTLALRRLLESIDRLQDGTGSKDEFNKMFRAATIALVGDDDT